MKKQSVETYISDIGQRILHQTKWQERPLVNSSITLRKRLRDLTDDDRTGFFNPTTNNWVSIDLPNLYSWNIVKPTIRGNKSSMITARVKINIEPRSPKDSRSTMAANVGSAILEQKERLQWTTELEERLADETQLGAGAFIRTRWNPNIKTANKVAKWTQKETLMPGVAICGSCGNQIDVEDDVIADEEGFATVPCECGADAQVTQFPAPDVVDILEDYAEHSFGDSQTLVLPFWNFRCDNTNTAGGLLENARWFEHHYLVGLDELQIEYPEAADTLQNTNTQWSYACRWAYALELGYAQPINEAQDHVDELREVRDIYLTPAKYSNFVATNKFELKDAEGKVRFFLEKGKGFADAVFEGKTFDIPPVWCFRLIGDTLIDVFPEDFREEFQYATFMANPSAFWGLFYTELLSLQDIVNYMLTLQVYHIRRNAITSIVYNKGVFDPDDFEEDLIPTKEEFPYDFPIHQQFGIIPALTLSQEPMQMLTMVIQGKGDVTQVQPAMVGEAQPNQPYHAQLLQKQQSLGLLAPAELSKAKAKVKWAKRQLNLVREHWTDENTEQLLAINQDWTEEFIEAFLHCNLDNDLIIDFEEGSEIPRSLLEREIALRQFMQDIMGMAQFVPGLLTAETSNEIIMRLIQAADIDIDVNNTESDLRLAENRFAKIKELILEVPPTTAEMATMTAQQIMSQPAVKIVLYPQLREGHQTEIEYYSDKIRNECATDDPNFLLIGCMNTMIDWHDQCEVQFTQRQMMMQMAAQQPMMEQQQEQEQAVNQMQMDRDAALSEQKQQESMMNQSVQRQDKREQMQHDMTKHALSLMADERERETRPEVKNDRPK